MRKLIAQERFPKSSAFFPAWFCLLICDLSRIPTWCSIIQLSTQIGLAFRRCILDMSLNLMSLLQFSRESTLRNLWVQDLTFVSDLCLRNIKRCLLSLEVCSPFSIFLRGDCSINFFQLEVSRGRVASNKCRTLRCLKHHFTLWNLDSWHPIWVLFWIIIFQWFFIISLLLRFILWHAVKGMFKTIFVTSPVFNVWPPFLYSLFGCLLL